MKQVITQFCINIYPQDDKGNQIEPYNLPTVANQGEAIKQMQQALFKEYDAGNMLTFGEIKPIHGVVDIGSNLILPDKQTLQVIKK